MSSIPTEIYVIMVGLGGSYLSNGKKKIRNTTKPRAKHCTYHLASKNPHKAITPRLLMRYKIDN